MKKTQKLSKKLVKKNSEIEVNEIEENFDKIESVMESTLNHIENSESDPENVYSECDKKNTFIIKKASILSDFHLPMPVLGSPRNRVTRPFKRGQIITDRHTLENLPKDHPFIKFE